MRDTGTGRWGEERAVSYLRLRGWHIVERNYACRYGEIDLIASRRGILAFVEVKTRKDASYGEAREFVTAAKQQRIRTTAAHYLMEHESALQPRFDVVEVYAPRGTDTLFPQIVHIEGAFE